MAKIANADPSYNMLWRTGFIGDGKYQVQCIKIIVTKINEGIIYMLVAAICVTNYNDDLITKAQWVGCFQYRPGSGRLLKIESDSWRAWVG